MSSETQATNSICIMLQFIMCLKIKPVLPGKPLA